MEKTKMNKNENINEWSLLPVLKEALTKVEKIVADGEGFAECEKEFVEELYAKVVSKCRQQRVRAFNSDNWRNPVELCETSAWDTPADKKVYGVNWSALGTRTPEQAKEFLKLVNSAVELCEELNKEVN
jgi:hypothetical protein